MVQHEGGKMKYLIILFTLYISNISLFAECPKEDFTHHYIDVPIDYSNPSLGTFKLYFEVNNDYNSTKPTLFIITDGQQPINVNGKPDFYKERINISLNVVLIEHRGMPCSKIDYVYEDGNLNWRKAYTVFDSNNVVEDIESVRKSFLVQNTKILITGGSGGGVLASQYLAKYSKNVSKAFLERTTDNTKTSNIREKEFFNSLLTENNAFEKFNKVKESNIVKNIVFFSILQRIGYDYLPEEKMQVKLIETLYNNDLSLFNKLYEKYKENGFIDPTIIDPKFLKQYLEEQPFMSVRLYEIFDGVSGSEPNNAFNYYFLEPLKNLGLQHKTIDVRDKLANIDTKVLLVTARWDHVIPYQEMVAMHTNMRHSSLIILNDTHSLTKNIECKNNLLRIFIENENDSSAINEYLNSGECSIMR